MNDRTIEQLSFETVYTVLVNTGYTEESARRVAERIAEMKFGIDMPKREQEWWA